MFQGRQHPCKVVHISLGDDDSNNRIGMYLYINSNNVFILFEYFKDGYGDNNHDIIKFESSNHESSNEKYC